MLLSGGRRLTPGGSLPARTSGVLHRASIESRADALPARSARRSSRPRREDADLHLLRSFGREAAERLRRIGRGASTRQGVRAPVDRHGDPSRSSRSASTARAGSRWPGGSLGPGHGQEREIERAARSSISGKIRVAGEVHLPRPVDQVAECGCVPHRRAGTRVARRRLDPHVSDRDLVADVDLADVRKPAQQPPRASRDDDRCPRRERRSDPGRGGRSARVR